MLRKIFLAIFLLFTFNLLIITSVYAAEEFATSYDVTYDVGTDGVTTVTEKITLRNLTSQYYATQFSLTIGSTQITDVSASDPSGTLNVTQEQKGTSTTLGVKFNQQVAGAGKVLPWTLKFKSKDFASLQGKVWEVTVPKVVTSAGLENYNLTLSIPQSFGEPTAISPTPRTQVLNSGKLFLTFDKEQLTNSGVSASFGTNQLFDFDLTYHLENSNLVPVITNIALPPDTEYQDVIYQRLDPKPINVTVDDDGNFLAWYRLTRGQKLDVKLIGSAKLYTNSKVKNPYLSDKIKHKYLKPDKYWEVDHPEIKRKVSEILGPNPPPSNIEKAKLIHKFVVSSLKYDPSRLSEINIERLGAVTALNNPTSAVCMEFTDLFITLARAAGIPARELDGFAYTSNPNLRPLSLSLDVLHAWPQFWDDKKGWVMIDPTWENTTGGVNYFDKLDLNHFVFAIKGESSQLPAPAGSYKYKGVNSKDVNVNFAKDDFLGKPQIDIQMETQNPIISGFPGKVKIKIANLGNSMQQSSNLTMQTGRITVLGNNTVISGPIPAFGTGEYQFDIRTKSLLENYNDTLEVNFAGQKYQKQVEVRPFFVFQGFPYILFGLLSIFGILYFGLLGGFIYRRKFLKKRSKR